MQIFRDRLDQDEQRVARKWRLASVLFYGSILAGLALLGAFHHATEVEYAAAKRLQPSATAPSLRD